MLSDGIPRSLEDVLTKHGQRLDRLERKPRGATGEELPSTSTYAQPTPPSPPLRTGDLWIDTDNENQMYRWSGTEWVLVRDAGIARGEIDSASTLLVSRMNFEAASDNLVTTYWQSTAPVSPSGIGDLWIDTDDKNLYRYDGFTWISQSDTSVGVALSASGMVSALGDARIRTYFSFGTPVPEGIGDLWADTDDGNKLYRWTGTTWVAVRTDLTQQSAATAAILLNNYSTNPIFDNWLAVDLAPVGYVGIGGGNPVIRETTRIRTAPYAIRWNVDDVTEAGITTLAVTSGAWDTVPNQEYLTVTVDFQLVNGALPGAGLIVTWEGLTPLQRVVVSLEDVFPSGVETSRWYRITQVIKRPDAAPTGTFTEVSATIYANSAVIGDLSAKELIYDQLSVRKSTAEEQAVYGLPAGTIAQQLAEITGDKITTFYTADADVPTPTAVGDLWYVVDKSNLVRRWDGSLWVSLAVGNGALDPGSVDGPILSGEIMLTSMIRTAADGARLELDNEGFRQYSTSQALKTHFPAADDAPNRFAGDVEAESLTITEGATFQGSSEIARGSGITMSSGVTAPIQTPGLSIEYDFVRPPTDVLKSGTLGNFALNPNEVLSINWRPALSVFVIYQKRANGTRAWLVNPDGTLNGDGFYDLQTWDVFGETTLGGKLHILVRNINNNVYYIGRVENGAQLPPFTYLFNIFTRLNTGASPQIGSTPTSLVFVETHPTSKQIYIRAFTMSAASYGAPTLTSTAITAGSSVSGSFNGIQFGSFDYGSPRYVVSHHASPYDIWNIQTGVLLVNDHFPSPTSNKRGMTWDGTNFWVYGAEGNLYKMGTYKWTTESPVWWVGNTWKDSVGGWETNLNVKRAITMRKRARLRVTFPVIPGSGGMNEPDMWRVYLQRSATSPASSAMHYQVEGSTPSVSLSSANFASAAPPLVNNFPGADPGYWESGRLSLVDGLPIFSVDGSGVGRWEGEGWHTVGSGGGEPAFQSGYSAVASYPVQFRKDPIGNVHVRGMAWTGGAAMGTPSTIFTLPTGYRPVGTLAHKWVTEAGPTTALALIFVDDDGLVVYQLAKSGAPTSVRLDFIFSTR